jgi:hypothetical protein
MGARKFALIFVALLVSGVLGLFCLVQAFPLGLTDGDKTEIMKMTLELALAPGVFAHIIDKEKMILSTENIDPNLVPKMPGVNLALLDPDKIQEKADREGDFLFLRFKQMQINGWRVMVSLDNIWAIGKNSQSRYLSGGGFTISYYRGLFGGWVGEGMAAWES